MTLGETIRRNSIWIVGGTTATTILQFGIGIILARLLVPEDFGLLVTVQVFTGLAGFIAGGGIGEALVQAKEYKEEDGQVVFTIQLLICLLIYTCFYYVAPPFAAWFDDPRYIDLLRVSALSFVIRPFANIPIAILRREMRFKLVIVTRLGGMVIGSVTSITMAMHGMGPWSLVVGGLVGALTGAALVYRFTRWRPGIRFVPSVAHRLGVYGIKMTSTDILVYARMQIPNLVISRMAGPAQVGLYNKADSLSLIPVQVVSGSVYQTVFRALSSVQDNLDQSKYIYLRAITLVAVYAFPIYMTLIWVAEPFIVFVYGEKWAAAAIPLQILAAAGLVRPLENISGAVIAAQDRLSKEVQIQFETVVILLLGVLIGIRWGIVGVAVGIVPSLLYNVIRMLSLAKSCVQVQFDELLRALIPAGVLNAVLLFAFALTHLAFAASYKDTQPALYLLLMLGVGGVAYGMVFLYAPIKSLTAESLRWKKVLRLV